MLILQWAIIVVSSLVCVFSCNQVGVVSASSHVGVVSSHLLQQTAVVAAFLMVLFDRLQMLLFHY
jgi:hypothetical protein